MDIPKLFGLKPGVPVARVLPEVNHGIGVSTVLTDDFGYETALLDANGVHPVERYPDEASALEGHQRWVSASKTLDRVKKLGWGDGDWDIELARVPFGVENRV